MREPEQRQRAEGRRVDTGRELDRREAIRAAAMSLTAFGAASFVPPALARSHAAHVHAAAQEEAAEAGEGGSKAFQSHEWELVRLLSELIVPADDHSGSALDAKVPEFIDLLASNNDELLRILTSGMLWLDHEMRERTGGKSFVEASDGERREMLDLLATNVPERDPGYESYEESLDYAGFADYTVDVPDLIAPGVRFFGWMRRLVVDSFYTSPIGIEDVGYVGNEFLRDYRVPEGSIRYAMERSPFEEE